MAVLAGCSRPQTAEQQKEEIKKAVGEELAKERAAQGTPAAPAPGAPEQGAPANAEPKKDEPPKQEAPPPPRTFTVDAGTPLVVRTTSSMSTKNAEAGNRFEATLQQPLVVEGKTLAKTGALVEGVVAEASQGGRVKGKAYLTLNLVSLHLSDGRTVAIKTGAVTQEAKSGAKKDLMRTGIAAGAGAAIGAIAGGGRGAAIGAGVGGAAGVGLNMATRGPAAQLPAETVVNFRLATPLTVTEKQ